MRDEQKCALRLRAAAEELRQIARTMARPDDRVALTSVASSLTLKPRPWTQPASRQPNLIAVNSSVILTVAAARERPHARTETYVGSRQLKVGPVGPDESARYSAQTSLALGCAQTDI